MPTHPRHQQPVQNRHSQAAGSVHLLGSLASPQLAEGGKVLPISPATPVGLDERGEKPQWWWCLNPLDLAAAEKSPEEQELIP